MHMQLVLHILLMPTNVESWKRYSPNTDINTMKQMLQIRLLLIVSQPNISSTLKNHKCFINVLFILISGSDQGEQIWRI